MNTVWNFQTDKIRTTFQRQTGSNWGRCCDCRDGSSKKEQHREENFFRPMDLYRNHFVLKDRTNPAVKAETKDGEKRIVSVEESVMQKNQAASVKKCSFQLCSHIGARHCTNRAKHRGALYVYILVVMLVVTTLSFIIALLFDNNLKNAVIQRDSLQLYYYSKAGADWAVDLINSSPANLKVTGSTESLLEQIKKMPYSSVDSSAVWIGQNDLMVDGEKTGHFKVEVDKVKRNVNKDNELDPAGTKERDYARVISTGSYADGTKLSKEDYTMTVLVPLDAPTEILYLIGRK